MSFFLLIERSSGFTSFTHEHAARIRRQKRILSSREYHHHHHHASAERVCEVACIYIYIYHIGRHILDIRIHMRARKKKTRIPRCDARARTHVCVCVCGAIKGGRQGFKAWGLQAVSEWFGNAWEITSQCVERVSLIGITFPAEFYGHVLSCACTRDTWSIVNRCDSKIRTRTCVPRATCFGRSRRSWRCSQDDRDRRACLEFS